MENDLISRQAAIDAIHNLYAIHGSEGSWIDQKDAFKALNSLPSAEPVRHGKWGNDCMGVLRCSECNAQAPWRFIGIMGDIVDYRWKANYCPHCGARMDEE